MNKPSKAIIQIEVNDKTYKAKFKVDGWGHAKFIAEDIVESIQKVKEQINEENKVDQLLKPNLQLDISKIYKEKQ